MIFKHLAVFVVVSTLSNYILYDFTVVKSIYSSTCLLLFPEVLEDNNFPAWYSNEVVLLNICLYTGHVRL